MQRSRQKLKNPEGVEETHVDAIQESVHDAIFLLKEPSEPPVGEPEGRSGAYGQTGSSSEQQLIGEGVDAVACRSGVEANLRCLWPTVRVLTHRR